MRRFLVFLLCVLILTGCGWLSTPAPTPADNPTKAPTAPPATETPTATPATTATAAAGPIQLPEANPPQQLLWLDNGQQVPGIASTGPLLVARQGKILYPFNPETHTAAEPPVGLPMPGDVLQVAPNLSSAIAQGTDGSLSVYDLAGTLLYTFPEANPYSAGYTDDGETITLNSALEWSIMIYQAETGEHVKTLTGFETAAPVYAGGLVPGGKTAYWYARATLQLQDVESEEMGTSFHYQDFIEALAFSPDGSRMAISVTDKVYLYSVPGGTELAQITRSQPVSSLRFSPDGNLLAAGYGPGIQFWDGRTLTPVDGIPNLNTFTGQVAFSPDGKYLAAAHDAGQITIHRLDE